ncbi:MAG: gliding motility-associated ABC transporter substrate-binding protein GldG [Sphingobacteriales bacterium]|nr:gliding motility-associated ABC transporter substrate-binding protein GldG [Sphingobacteriales bacterium]
MWAVCKKELRQSFSNLTGYIAIIVFLLLNGLLLFVFPDTDILAFGYASLEKFFDLAPWILLLLIPAITMRSLAEEFRMGTFEILQTVPLSRAQLVIGKYLASLIVVIIALVPTLLYFLSIQRLSGQAGIDVGATLGSYIGLIFLSAVFTSIGILCSSWTSNAVVAFIAAAFACFLLYSGFNAISQLPVFAAGADYYIEMFGIDFHYRSISRGVIDSRDIIYFLSIIFLFLRWTNWNLARKLRGPKNKLAGAGKVRPDWLGAGGVIAVLVVLNLLAGHFHYRLDLTQEKRYTLSAPTKQMLRNLDDNIEVEFFLQGDLKAGIRKLSKSAQELLQEFNEYADGKIRVKVVDPLANLDDTTKMVMLDSLRRMGIQPKTQVAQAKKGEEQSQRVVLPGALLHYKNKVVPVDLLKGVQVGREGQPEEQLYTNAETLLEFKFGSAIDRITRKHEPAVGYVLGNGEPLDFTVYNLIQGLRSNYRFGVVRLDSLLVIPPDYNALVIVKPTKKFTDREKLTLDQYVMHGGQIIWAVDRLYAEMDSLRQDRETIAFDRGLELDDLFFKYGVRIQPDLVLDMQCASLNMVVGMNGDKPQLELIPWPYFPLLNGSLTHPISKNLDPVYAKFANSIDTVKAEGIQKTVLLQTSANSKTVSTPALITFESVKVASDPRAFTQHNIPVAMLLEGKFQSLFAGRVGAAVADSLANVYKQPFLASAEKPGRVIVMADADIVMNDVSQRGPLAMGYNKDIPYQFANQDFVENCFEYLVNPSGILETRAKDFTLRLLDPAKVEQDRNFWQFINIGLPILLVIIGGYLYQLLRRKRYA